MSQTMRAIVVEGDEGPPEALKFVEAPKPAPKPGEILIRVEAAGVNRPDLLQRRGLYPPPPGASNTIGLEVAGEVVEGAGRWKAGDKVCALLAGGGYAEFVTCDARHALPIPRGLTVQQAATLPETAFTVFTNMFEGGKLKAGETVLVHGATSGIGVTAIQMAKAAGAKVIATARGRAKADRALSLGADIAVDATTEDFEAVALGAGGVDVVLDMVAGPYFAKNLAAANIGARLVEIAWQGGDIVEVSISQLARRRLVITGSTLRPRDADEKARLAGEVERIVWPWVEAGKVKPVIDRSYPIADAASAHAYLESDAHFGKVVLTFG
jgi:putative PIG3 family NAD(P)H quinone oxidoreductase